MVTKYLLVTPKNVSSEGEVYTSTFPTATNEFEIWNICEDYVTSTHYINFYDVTKDRRQIWVAKGDEIEINNWITANSDMVIEKTFAEADTIGKELHPQHIVSVHKVITEDGKVISEEDINKTISEFDLQTRLDELGI